MFSSMNQPRPPRSAPLGRGAQKILQFILNEYGMLHSCPRSALSPFNGSSGIRELLERRYVRRVVINGVNGYRATDKAWSDFGIPERGVRNGPFGCRRLNPEEAALAESAFNIPVIEINSAVRDGEPYYSFFLRSGLQSRDDDLRESWKHWVATEKMDVRSRISSKGKNIGEENTVQDAYGLGFEEKAIGHIWLHDATAPIFQRLGEDIGKQIVHDILNWNSVPDDFRSLRINAAYFSALLFANRSTGSIESVIERQISAATTRRTDGRTSIKWDADIASRGGREIDRIRRDFLYLHRRLSGNADAYLREKRNPFSIDCEYGAGLDITGMVSRRVRDFGLLPDINLNTDVVEALHNRLPMSAEQNQAAEDALSACFLQLTIPERDRVRRWHSENPALWGGTWNPARLEEPGYDLDPYRTLQQAAQMGAPTAPNMTHPRESLATPAGSAHQMSSTTTVNAARRPR
ncbi:hypothetical protein ACFV2D_37460 [Streptomyces capillispiralis]|uniref:hypothetical protein n=1 Tax=Streptomyces capillispiralis TaxID=68182 RepID=UPI0036A9DEFB